MSNKNSPVTAFAVRIDANAANTTQIIDKLPGMVRDRHDHVQGKFNEAFKLLRELNKETHI